MHFSLKQLMLLVAYVGVAAVSLRFASASLWTVVSGIGILLLMVAAILALLGRGLHRIFAIGFTVCVIIYGALLFLSSQELDPYDGRMPTSNLLRPVFEAVVTMTPVPIPANSFGSPMLLEHPARMDFMSIGHFWFALLFGWLGGLFACWVRRRVKIEGLPRTEV